jgi:hypothetical protein
MPKDPRLERAGVEGFNKPKRTPSHPTKSHVVVAKEGDQIKTIRFGQQGVSGSPPRENESKADAARRASFKARHAENIAKGKMSAAWWSDRTKWAIMIPSTIGIYGFINATYFGFSNFV